MTELSGIIEVQVQLAGGDWTSALSLGVPLTDSAGYQPEVQSVELADYNMEYAGSKNKVEFDFTDFEHFSTLTGYMKADTKIDLRVKKASDESYLTLASGANVLVKPDYKIAVGDKNRWKLTLSVFEV